MKHKKKQSVNSSPVLPPAPDISYIVSCYNRPVMLPVILWALKGQTHFRFECIVTDNASDEGIAKLHKKAVDDLNDSRFRYVRTYKKIPVEDCYWAAEYALKQARGSWYCFPCDDTYLVPEFGARMLEKGMRDCLDMVFCEDVVVGTDASGQSGYRVWKQYVSHTLKTSFIVRASSFPGFTKPGIPSPVAVDYFFSHLMNQSGKRIGSVREVMCVHN